MERADWSRIAHEGMAIMNPLSSAKLDEAIEVLELERGARVVDLGCGKGELLRRLVERYAATAIGVDTSPELLAEARRHGIETVEGDATAYDGDGFDLAASVGGPVSLGKLASLVRSGGFVLYGDGYWRRDPDAAYLAALGATREELSDYAGTIAAGEELGLVPLHAVVASVDDFDRYEWAWSRNGERYAAAHPDEPGVDQFLAWIRNGRRRYVELGGRETLGFGLFLFRA